MEGCLHVLVPLTFGRDDAYNSLAIEADCVINHGLMDRALRDGITLGEESLMTSDGSDIRWD